METIRWTMTAAQDAALFTLPYGRFAQGSRVLPPFSGGTFVTNQPAPHSSLSRGSRAALHITDGRYQDAVTLGTLVGMHFTPRWELETLISWTPSRLEAREGLRTGSVTAQAYMYG